MDLILRVLTTLNSDGNEKNVVVQLQTIDTLSI
jgi:hypothetical protein